MPRKNKKLFTYKQFLKAIKKATTKGFAKSIIVPVVFPNALGITVEEINRAKDKKTKKS